MSLIQQIDTMYNLKKNTPCDINEHLPTLLEYSKNCNKIVECGVRNCVSSWAFLNGLISNHNGIKKSLIQVDIENNNLVEIFGSIARDVIDEYKFYHQSDLDCPLEKCDLLFIDTFHVYG